MMCKICRHWTYRKTHNKTEWGICKILSQKNVLSYNCSDPDCASNGYLTKGDFGCVYHKELM